MNIVSLNHSDFGGLSYTLCKAIRQHTDHHAISITNKRLYTRKPTMLRNTPQNNPQIRRLIRNADVLHLNESMLIPEIFKLHSFNHKDKKVILHAHGTFFRNDPDKIKQFYRTRFPQLKIITSTPDLLAQGEGTWFPSITPVKELNERYKTRRNNPPVIYYSPTKNPRVWDFPQLQDAADTLKREGLDFHINVRSQITHRLNMELKSKADIYFDELKIFYGINALEAAAFGLVVIHGISPYCRAYLRRRRMRSSFKAVRRGDVGGLTDALRRLVGDRRHRVRAGRASLRYVERVHSPLVCVKRFMSLVE